MINNNIIVIMLNNSDTGIIEKITFLLLLLGVATNLLIATGNDKVAITINNENVGINKLYNPNPSVPKCLEIIILKMKPKNLDKNPPVSSMKVDIKNLFFSKSLIIFKYMKTYKKIYL